MTQGIARWDDSNTLIPGAVDLAVGHLNARILVVDEDYEGIVAIDPENGARVELPR